MDREHPFANLYYFRVISRIGGTEQFLYELAKKYHKYDLTIMYDDADFDQLARLQKLVRCIRRKRDKIYYTEKAFYNFNIDAIDKIEAKEHIFVSHAIYAELGYYPPIDHPKIDKLLGVSKYAEHQIKKQEAVQNVDKPVVQCYNPLTLEKPDKVLHIISACRLEDKTKGGDRTMKLIEALDRYCEKHGTHYLWTIFTNSTRDSIDSPNVAVMKPRPDVRPYIADSDWLVQLSNDMESYCYSIQESLGYGVGVVTTPLSVLKEFKIPENSNIVLDWDCSNVDEVAKKMFEQDGSCDGYKPPKDSWSKLLVKKPSDYTYKEQKMLVKPITNYYDIELQKHVGPFTQAFEVSMQRAKKLTGLRYVRVL